MKKTTLITFLAVPFLAVSVHAEDKKPGKPDRPKADPAGAFKKLDTNSDSKVSLEEFKAAPRFKKDGSKAEDIFKRKDKDSDGNLTVEEFSAKPEKPAKPGKPGKDAPAPATPPADPK